MQDFVHQPYDTELVLWLGGSRAIGLVVWEFPKIGVPYFGVLIIRILLCFGGTILGSPSFGNSHLGFGPSMVPVPTAHPRQTALPRRPGYAGYPMLEIRLKREHKRAPSFLPMIALLRRRQQ